MLPPLMPLLVSLALVPLAFLLRQKILLGAAVFLLPVSLLLALLPPDLVLDTPMILAQAGLVGAMAGCLAFLLAGRLPAFRPAPQRRSAASRGPQPGSGSAA